MEDRHGSSSGIVGQHSGIWMSLRDEDFEEEEVWDVFKNTDNYGISKSKVNKVTSSSSSPISVNRRLPTEARMIPTMAARTSSSSNNSSTSSSHETQVVLQQSAPVRIPDWSKIYNITNKNNNARKDVSSFDDDHGFGHCRDVDDNDEGDEDEDENGDEFDSKLPPHEFIARRLARSHISSFSVVEGVGRTLKGRDLSKVRNAVLSKTGFLESL
ncbi:hypothetical protein QN277_016294 [Acacia crassicarpa]|uniref:Senescence regulator n=1 Tax=Acacia crassicarpa TaxID=499986 RepID=A0AAE1TBU2_9FABA|nr:hypothetical protein QN277_016294 [Acacia crassicarpa]